MILQCVGCLKFYEMSGSASKLSQEGHAGKASAREWGGLVAKRFWHSGPRSESYTDTGEGQGGVVYLNQPS